MPELQYPDNLLQGAPLKTNIVAPPQEMSKNPVSLLRFLFKIDFIIPDPDKQSEIRTGIQHWTPPTISKAITTIGTTGWCQWSNSCIRPARTEGDRNSKVCSLFFDSECQHYLGVPFDCREIDVKEYWKEWGVGWRRVMFRYVVDDRGIAAPISVMGFDLEHNVIAAVGSTSPWMPQLIPESYANNSDDAVNCFETTGIAGDLSLLVALAAFANDSLQPLNIPRLLQFIERCFQPPEWKAHNIPFRSEYCLPFGLRNTKLIVSGKHATGVVVSIRLDPDAKISADHLKAFQNGVYGPLIRA